MSATAAGELCKDALHQISGAGNLCQTLMFSFLRTGKGPPVGAFSRPQVHTPPRQQIHQILHRHISTCSMV